MKSLVPVTLILATAILVLFGVSSTNARELRGAAPNFSLKTLNAPKINSLKDFKGKVVLLNFWATWCKPCRDELPHLEAIHKKYEKLGFSVVGVNIDEEVDLASDLVRKTNITFPSFSDPKSQVSDLYKIEAMPSTIMIDRKGNMRYLHNGYKPGYEVAYENQVKKLVRER